jgi:cytoskeletal protein RodZ
MDEPILKGENRKERRWTVLLTIVLVIAIAVILWLVFGKNNQNNKSTMPNSQTTNSSTNKNSQINSLISYDLPDSWKTVSCNNASEVILIVPTGRVTPDCASLSDDWPMKIMMDPKNTTECSQIKVNSQQVTNHVCSSQTINGNKIFVASTTYNNKSTYGKDTKVSEYFVDTKSGVVKLEYADDLASTEDDYQAQFDQIANSIKIK